VVRSIVMGTGATDPLNEVGPLVGCPVVVHRWFETGEGWAWHPDMPAAEFVPCLAKVLRNRPESEETGTLEMDRTWWLYHHAPDHQVGDRKARGRQPSILRAVALPGNLKNEYRARLAECLAEIPLPDRAGPTPELILEVPQAWLEVAEEPQGRPARGERGRRPGRMTPSPWIGRMLVMTAIVACLVAFVVVFVYPDGRADGQVSAKEVRAKLLEPLGVQLPENAPVDEVTRRFCELYCKPGMAAHCFSGINPRDFDKTEGSQPQHPDWLFARQRFEEFQRAIAHLPDAPVKEGLTNAVNAVARKIPAKERGLRGPAPAVAATNAVGVLERRVVGELRKAGFVGGTRCGDYEQWFFASFRWEPGKPFPWDAPVDPKCRKLALLFTRTEQAPQDILDAAGEMLKWLEKWGVKGVSEADVRERPWLVGRCFVEFLSLKHCALSEKERTELDRDNSLVWQQLKKLPSDGWAVRGYPETATDTPDIVQSSGATHNGRESVPVSGLSDRAGWKPGPAEPWLAVHECLQKLAKCLGVDSKGSDKLSDAALAQRIGNALGDWPADATKVDDDMERTKKQQEVGELTKEISDCQSRMGQLQADVQHLEKCLAQLGLDSDKRPDMERQRDQKKQEWEKAKGQRLNLERALDERNRELKELDNKARTLLRSNNEQLDRLWDRLTGASGSDSAALVVGQE